MTNGYDEEDGEVLVPFDLRGDVIIPLNELREEVPEIKQTVNDHLTEHSDEKKALILKRENRKKTVRKIIIGAVSFLAPIVIAIVASKFEIGIF